MSDILSKLVAMGAQRKNVQLGLQAAAKIARAKIDEVMKGPRVEVLDASDHP